MGLRLLHLLTGHVWGPWMTLVAAGRADRSRGRGRLCDCGAIEFAS